MQIQSELYKTVRDGQPIYIQQNSNNPVSSGLLRYQIIEYARLLDTLVGYDNKKFHIHF